MFLRFFEKIGNGIYHAVLLLVYGIFHQGKAKKFCVWDIPIYVAGIYQSDLCHGGADLIYVKNTRIPRRHN